MNDWNDLGQKIRKFINPATFPVAVKIQRHEDQIPQKSKRPLRDLGVKMAPCQGSAMARRYGWTVAFTREDVGCAIAAHTYGWERLEDLKGPIHFLTQMNYVSDEKAAREALKGFYMLDTENEPVVVYAPLERAEFDPDVVLVYVNPAQMMRLIHGATQHSGKPVTGRFSGRAASCTEGVLGAFLDNAPKVIIPGNGDRVWAACQDHEVVMAVPGNFLPELIEGLEKTHKTGIRYPIPSYLRYRPEVGLALPLSDIFKPDEADKFIKRKGG